MEEKVNAVEPNKKWNLSDEENVVSDEEDDPRALKRRVVNEYEESEKSSRLVIGGGFVGGAERLSEAVMEETKTKTGFITTVGGN